ncbi:hypothetical protein HG535_0D00760 [Zygotorulaspora mrakii]|uniref:Nucleoporin POM152 n=1 Tax=Zygotorulaspora mrakii TaxID=42260 RepID=A0A7H9B328_ZYGMR|nr:uncharacterized protein HG535_0D00760 [Zygotorulaspora mrakii]QLG72369.1 hypothetical protein HG535_0D00760 [Zygotorulaspora mrakii]
MDREHLVNANTPRGNHWIGATATSSSYLSPSNADRKRRHIRKRSDGPEDTLGNRPNEGGLGDELAGLKMGQRSELGSGLGLGAGTMASRRSTRRVSSELPLISPELVEVSRQRALAVLVFAIIQGYKIYDLILLKTGLPVLGLLYSQSRLNFVSKYFIIDSFFLYLLPSFKIPKLNFRPWIVMLQIICMTLSTIVLCNDNDFIIVTGLIAIWKKFNTKEMTLAGSSVNFRKVMDTSSHFKGALTIKILPENTAMLNPLQDSYCLPLDTDLLPTGHISVPIRINSTVDISLVQLEFTDFYTNESELRNLTGKDFKSVSDLTHLLKRDSSIPTHLHDTSSIRYLELPLKEVGFYQIQKIVDSKNLSLKIYTSHLIVPHCPVATISGSGDSNRCIGDPDKVSIDLQGVPPMKLSYSKSINGKSHTYTDSNLVPEFFESPLQSTSKRIFSLEDLKNLKWCKTYPVTINLDLPASQDGKYTYKIDKVVDGLGNTMDFSKIPQNVRRDYDLSYDFNVHGIPKASLEEKFDPKSSTKRSIIVRFEKTQDWESSVPYGVNILFTDENGKSEYLNIATSSLNHEFEAKLPGNYELQSVNSNHCPGVVIGKTSVLVTKPIPPQLVIKSTPILEQCVGQIGLNFDLTFTGVPPFNYKAFIYKIVNQNRKLYDTKRYTSQGTRNQFSYNPATEGDYEIVFDQLTNHLFTDAISLTPRENYTFKTSMRVKPGAQLRKSTDIKLCLGQQTKIPVSLHGEAPFFLEYDIVETSSNKRTSYEIKDIVGYDHDIVIPKFDVGGSYILSLVSIRDSSGCTVRLSEPDAKIYIRRDVPSASFNLLDNTNESKIKQGSYAEIPLKLAGEGPFYLKYQHLGDDGQVLGIYNNKFDSNYKPALKASKEGYYELVEVKDASCKGYIERKDTRFKVSFLKKPTFEVSDKNKIVKLTESTFAKQEICQGVEGNIDLSLSGSAPFVLNYDIITPNGHVTAKRLPVTTKYATIRLSNEDYGEYVVIIGALYDANYAEDDSTNLDSTSEEVIIKQVVNALPVVKFSESGKTLKACSTVVNDDATALEQIDLKFTRGKGPFSVTFSIYHESTSRSDLVKLDGITADTFNYQKLYEGLKLGNHIVTIEKVVDANGCINEFIPSQDNFVLISITDVPKIHLLDPSMDYCVGDHVTYQLNGAAPFVIKYEFNGVQLKSKEHSSQFVRLASEPGEISIASLGDSTSQCIVDFTAPNMQKEHDKLSLHIHEIPSVTVSQGKNLVEDIHEGDQAEIIFSFEGNPPFSLTYVRTEEAESSHGKVRPQVVETHKVTDIYAYEYRVLTSLQGTYEAIQVSDAFCFAKNDAYF